MPGSLPDVALPVLPLAIVSHGDSLLKLTHNGSVLGKHWLLQHRPVEPAGFIRGRRPVSSGKPYAPGSSNDSS